MPGPKPVEFNLRWRANPETGCYEWQAGINPNGYGIRQTGGKNKTAHRVAWELANGPIPIGLQVLHRCDVRHCVNPAHLFLGTNADNVRDKVAKNRQARNGPNRSSFAKLWPGDVDRIRDIWKVGDSSQSEIAQYFGIHQSQVSRIVNEKRWKAA